MSLGHEVYVITSDRYGPQISNDDSIKSSSYERIVTKGFLIEEGFTIWRLPIRFEISNQLWLIGLEQKIVELKPDLIIVHGIFRITTIRVARLKKRYGNFKLICDEHTISTGSLSKLRIMYPIFKKLFSNLVRESSDSLVAVSNESKIFIHRKGGIPLHDIKVIPLGADHILFHRDIQARQEIRTQLAFNNEVIFINTGKINKIKGVNLLIEAVAKLATKHNDFKILILGKGDKSYIEELENNIKSQKLDKYFTWHGLVPNNELYRYYSAADVAVWPRQATISTLEAMSCSLPVIVSDVPVAAERVSFDNGLIVKNSNSQELSEHMEFLLINNEIRKEMGENSRRAIEEKLNWKTISKQFLSLVEE